MVRLDVAVAREAEVDVAVQEQQRRALVLVQRVERDAPARRPRSCAGHARLDHDRAAELLGAGRDVERVQSLDVVGRSAGRLLRLRDDVDRVRALVDHRRARDPDLGRDVAALTGVVGRNRRDAVGRVDEAVLPERRRASAVGVVRVDAVVLGRDVHDVVRPLPRDGDVLHVERRGVGDAVEREREELPEARRVDVRRREHGLVQVLPGAHVVVVVREHPGVVRRVGRRDAGERLVLRRRGDRVRSRRRRRGVDAGRS